MPHTIADFLAKLSQQGADRGIALLETVLESIPDAAFIVEHPTRRILWANSAAARIFGYGRQELVGRDTQVLHVNEPHFREFGRRIGPAWDRGEPWRGRFWMRRKDASRFPTEHLITPATDVMGQRVVVSIVRDLSPADAGGHPHYGRLSPREREVLDYTMQGLSAKETAQLLSLSPRTVELHRSKILEKLEVRSITDLLAELLAAATRAEGRSLPSRTP